jgi:hypothetical protein
VAALWLHRPEIESFEGDIFIPLPGAPQFLVAGRHYSSDELLKELQNKAREQQSRISFTSS